PARAGPPPPRVSPEAGVTSFVRMDGRPGARLGLWQGCHPDLQTSVKLTAPGPPLEGARPSAAARASVIVSLRMEGTLAPTALLEKYRSMAQIRRFEEEAARAYAQGKIGGFLHLYIGQESIAVAAHEAMQAEDYVFQTYRDHGIALARGMSPDAAMAELFGKDTGCSRGLGGSMHFFDPERGFYGGWGIV